MWYFENEIYFRSFLDLKQGGLSVLGYGDMFAWLQDKCGLEDDEEHDLISFIIGLRPEIVEKMNDSNNIHEAYWEAIHVKRMLKMSHLVEVTPQKEKSLHITDRVEEPVPHFNRQIKGCVMFSIFKIYVQAQDQPTNRKFI